ncbi:SRPBCC domain-containing protein [Streptomyces caniscabiei]|uniref:SRPBCC family protein n=1 Tax=Streptomyces caniscabiei TaxID=2746961 RepID=UPI0029A949F8|nr:SRPBCC domain-containing protein [Streptomyces caniscabiei]MDX2776436.1 SRPBCC domain-containing protein [Streptomyces caniscabiei]
MDKTKVTKDFDHATLIVEQTFNVPRQRLWDAYANVDQFAQWWGPEGWETTVKEFNFAPGGKNHYCMKCVDKSQGEWFGQESWGMMQFENVDEPSQFIYKDYFSDAEGTLKDDMPVMTITMEFIEDGDKTALVTRGVVQSKEQLEQLVNMGMIEGLTSTMDKLEKFVETN